MAQSRTDFRTAAAGMAAALCAVIAVFHLQDGDWLAFDKRPVYVLIGYLLLEVVSIAVAVRLVIRATPMIWALALGCGAGPFIGYVLSRGPGLPGYSDDRGAWSEPLGIVSLIVEGALIILAVSMLVARKQVTPPVRRAIVLPRDATDRHRMPTVTHFVHH